MKMLKRFFVVFTLVAFTCVTTGCATSGDGAVKKNKSANVASLNNVTVEESSQPLVSSKALLIGAGAIAAAVVIVLAVAVKNYDGHDAAYDIAANNGRGT